MSTHLTRKSSSCPIFGAPKKLPVNVLPTYSDVIQYYSFIRNEKKSNTSKEPTVKEIASVVCNDVMEVWNRASLPIVSQKRVQKLIETYHQTYRGLLKSFKGRQGNESYKKKMANFKADANKLFDICSCKCNPVKCNCQKERKVPKDEIEFLKDQRTKRNMVISSVDLLATKKIQKMMKRKEKTSTFLQPQPSTSKEIPMIVPSSSTTTESLGSSPNDNTDESSHSPTEDLDETRNMVNLPSLALVCERTGVSDRVAAMIASSALKDYGVISHEDKSDVVDRSKLRRERQKLRKESQDQESSKLVSLYFDGRKDKTLVQEKKGDKYFKATKVEDHYVLVQEPGQAYYGHVTCASGSAEGILSMILEYMAEKKEDLSNLKAVGCDGTAVNTGAKGGVIRRLEVHLGRSLQWNICLLHANELPLRHLFHHLDGNTTGPKTYSGTIGKLLLNCEDKNPVKYEAIPLPTDVNFPTNVDDLSTDQKYLLKIMNAVSSGICSLELANTKPGPMSHSRWLTTANRILRLYVSTEVPSENLKTLATFIMNVYGPMWFSIKTMSTCFDGPKHVFAMVQRCGYLNESLKKIVLPVIQRNAFYAHPENLLISMLADESKVLRELAYRRIMKVREAGGSSEVRKFEVPELNPTATSYNTLIYWHELTLTEPPLTKDMTAETLQTVVEENNMKVIVPELPCHTQCVERYVKLVTNASSKVVGYKARDGFIRNQIKSRKSMPAFETKSNFV